MKAQKTYWHLAELGHKPTDYEIATSRLLYYPGRGFEVETPIARWYERFARGSPLRLDDWERFQDPRQTTYTRYTELQEAKEVFVRGLLRALDGTAHDRELPPAWVQFLGRILGPLPYPVHGLQMVAAYLGSMAPGGRLVSTCLMQAADEIRRIQVLVFRTQQLRRAKPDLADGGRELWQEAPAWQPLRALVERLLVTYDWGEAFVALNLVVKPMFDGLFTAQLARLAQLRGDGPLARILFSLGEDGRWHLDWSLALVRLAIEEHADNRAVIAGWIEQWGPAALAAVEPLGELADREAGGSGLLLRAIEDDTRALWDLAGLPVAGGR
jgi:toluene monooxygenase system protein E